MVKYEIREIIIAWRNKIEGYPRKEARAAALRDVFSNIIGFGYTEEDCKLRTTKELLLRALVSPNLTGADKKKIENTVSNSIDKVIDELWGPDLKSFDPSLFPKKDDAFVPSLPTEDDIRSSKKEDRPLVRVGEDPPPEVLACVPKPEVEFMSDEEFSKMLCGVK